MSYKVSSWGKSRLKGALSICNILIEEFQPILEEISKEKEEIPEITKIMGIIAKWKGKIEKKLGIIETDHTKDLIESSL